mmetsp:Transcript_28530/g.35267  ORF Transcript_28530/g.35267 Transcript_28530/m.35267 type:complete len:132 (-) Transcript_28530:388-783(-)
MQDVPRVECLQAGSHLDENVPNVALAKLRGALLVLHDFGVEVAALGILHHDAKRGGIFVKESLLVCYYVLVIDGRQNAHFVQSVLLLLFCQPLDLNLFESVLNAITFARDLVNLAIGANTNLLVHVEVAQT